MGFIVVKTTGLNPGFQRKNRFWKICTESSDIDKNVSKFSFPSKMSKISSLFANISGPEAYFSKPIFLSKPWVQAGCFEYHGPINRKNVLRTYKGVLEFKKIIFLKT